MYASELKKAKVLTHWLGSGDPYNNQICDLITKTLIMIVSL